MIDIDKTTLANWQRCVDLMATIVGVPAGLIMRAVNEDIEVFVSSRTEGNPYEVGDSEHLWGSGLYCEAVIRTNERLIVADAHADPDWDRNPDIKLGMISYLGFPIHLPDGNPFGTICVLDNKHNAYSETYSKLVHEFSTLIEGQIALLAANAELREKSDRIQRQETLIGELRDIIPICAHCRKIRDDEGYWQAIETYLAKVSEVSLSHGICPECLRRHYPRAAEAYEKKTGKKLPE